MSLFRCPNKVSILYIYPIPDSFMLVGHHICIGHCIHTQSKCWFYNFLRIFINSCWKKHFMSLKTFKASNRIRYKRWVCMANMRYSVWVINRRGNEKFWWHMFSLIIGTNALFSRKKARFHLKKQKAAYTTNKLRTIYSMKHTFNKTLVGVILFVLWMWAGYSGTIYYFSSDEEGMYQEREIRNYQYINPLLECEVKTLWSQQKYIPFEEELREKIQTNIIDKNPNVEVSYYFRNLRNGPWFWHNEEAIFAPASLMKLPVTMAYMKWAEEYPTIWAKAFSGITENTTVQNIVPGESIQWWLSYSLDDLIKFSLIFSDNNANSTLLANIPQELLFRVFRELNIPIIDNLEQWEDEYITVKEYASFFRILFNSSYLSRTSSEHLLKTMSLAENTRWIKRKLPADIIVSHKFWERGSIDSKTGVFAQQFHDCGIVYFDSYPYLLCVMTRGTDGLENLETIIEDISFEIFTTIKSYY